MLKNFTLFPVLETKRLILRQIELDDAKIIFDLYKNEFTSKFLSRDFIESIENALQIIENLNRGIILETHIYWVISLKTNRKAIGTICLWNFCEECSCAEIGYELHPDFQKKGLMQEAVEKVLKYGFENMELEKIEAFTKVNNSSSIKLLERNGFVNFPQILLNITPAGNDEINICYSLTKVNFF